MLALGGGDKQITETMIVWRNHEVGIAVGVLGYELTGQQHRRSLISLVEALGKCELIGERSGRLDWIRLGLGSEESLPNSVEIVIVRTRRYLIRLPHCLIAGDGFFESREPHRSLR